jgi:hypothetical protein
MLHEVSLKEEMLVVGVCNDSDEAVALIFKVKMKMEAGGSSEVLVTIYKFTVLLHYDRTWIAYEEWCLLGCYALWLL